MTSLFDTEYHRANGSEDAELVLWVCPSDDHDSAVLQSYWAELTCSLCGQAMERSD